MDYGTAPGADGVAVRHVRLVSQPAVAEELQAHFASCGTIDRITILCDKVWRLSLFGACALAALFTGHVQWTGKPKGYAYVMFLKPESVANGAALAPCLLAAPHHRAWRAALLLNGTTFRGRCRVAASRCVAKPCCLTGS